MGFAEFNNEAKSRGGTFVNLKNKGDKVAGTIVGDPVKRPQIFKGTVLTVQKEGPNKGKTRYEWVFVLKTAEGNLVKVPCKEKATWAITSALQGRDLEIGGHLQLEVVSKEDGQQGEFRAIYSGPTKKFDFPTEDAAQVADDDEPPF